jgi:hypothetical protein
MADNFARGFRRLLIISVKPLPRFRKTRQLRGTKLVRFLYLNTPNVDHQVNFNVGWQVQFV